jgi:pimeloyl-ACP methyl ester carboxylesterase
MRREFVQIGDQGITLRHNGIEHTRGTILFLHGLGDSGRAFDEALTDRRLDPFNVLVPDMPGYGEGGDAVPKSISFDGYVELLHELFDVLELKRLLLVAHSMGGAVATLLGAADRRGMIRGVVNIEGNLLTYDQFISGKAIAAADEGTFEDWFRVRFMEETVLKEWAPGNPACQRYYESLRICQPQAFLDNCRELVRRSSPTPDRPSGEIAEKYLSLSVPKMYCLGEQSLPPETLAFLKHHNENCRMFPGASHSVMIDVAPAFYAELRAFADRVL